MTKITFLLIFVTSISYNTTLAQNDNAKKAQATEVWEPQPRVVVASGNFLPPPADAIVLFNGTNLNEWVSTNNPDTPAQWIVSDGTLTVKKGTGNIQTKRLFTDYQIHLEWRIPEIITGSGQSRGNSGLFMASTGPGDDGYELQILDCYNNKTYANGQTGSIYKQHIPLVNACKKPGEWQTYDVVWTAPRFNDDGTLKSPARITAFHNGVLVQNNVELKGTTVWMGEPSYSKKHGPAPIKLQDHGDPSEPISFRNIWVREL